MNRDKQTDLAEFFVIGINYKKTDTLVRGSFAISPEQYGSILSLAPSFGVNQLFVLSTCNRTEIYGFAETPGQLIDLLCSQTIGKKEVFAASAYTKNGFAAVKHLFKVGAGLDSQILGDYEIVGQIRQAVKFAKDRKFVHAFMERMLNAVLQCSKLIKNKTELSNGTVSLSFIAVQYIRERVNPIADKKILLLGTGKIGRITSKNLIDYLGTRNIVLVNRTPEKAAELASELGLQYAGVDQLDKYLGEADIILVATNAAEPVILKSQLEDRGEKLILDLSIPCNVEKEAKSVRGITLVDVDELSTLKDKTLQKREAEIPKAKAIIAEHIEELLEWYEMRKHLPVLNAVKIKLKEIHSSPFFIHSSSGKKLPNHNTDQKIQRVINGMATKMRSQNQRGCHYIEAINEFIAGNTN